MNIFDKIVENMTDPVEDGCQPFDGEEVLERCPECGDVTRKKAMILGKPRIQHCTCTCEKAKIEAIRQAEIDAQNRRMHEVKVAKLKASGLMDTESGRCTFETDDLSNEKITGVMKSFVNQWDYFRGCGTGLLLWGKVGTGKTFSACCVANALLDQEVPVLVTSFARIANTAWGLTKDKQAYFDDLNSFDLLVIDDLGVERKSEYMQEIVFTVIDGRIRSGKPMIITTNLTLAEMKNCTDLAYQRIYSRILQACHPVLVDGDDKRRQKTRQQYQDIQLMLGL